MDIKIEESPLEGQEMERGLKQGKAPKNPVVKWLTIGFLGTVGLLVLMVAVICWFFTPLIHIDHSKGEFKLLGGLITINDKDEWDGDFYFREELKGERDVDLNVLKSVDIKFRNGKFDIRHSDEAKVIWDCNVQNKAFKVNIDDNTGVATIDMSDADGANCELILPKIAYKVKGQNGKVSLMEPVADTAVDMTNGQISVKEAPQTNYTYALDVSRGVKSNFVSSNAPDAVKIKVTLVNGVIDKD